MEVTVVSHAGIANRIKNLLSAMSQHDKVTTLHDTMTFLFPSIENNFAVNKLPLEFLSFTSTNQYSNGTCDSISISRSTISFKVGD